MMETHYNERIRATIFDGSDHTPLTARVQTLYDPWGQVRRSHQADDDLGIVQAQIMRLEIRAEQMLIPSRPVGTGEPGLRQGSYQRDHIALCSEAAPEKARDSYPRHEVSCPHVVAT
jgi:hypothetical protein